MKNFTIIDFKFAEVTDNFNLKYKEWSRIYEYSYVIEFIRWNTLKDMEKPEIHNSSWGYEGVHVMFRDELDMIGKCTHSDIISSTFRETYYYNITEEKKEFENKFDFVLNISTIEHLNSVDERIMAIQNLYKQLKAGGYLILTFDYPRVNLTEIEELVQTKCKIPINLLNGENSASPNNNYINLNIVYLIIQKNK